MRQPEERSSGQKLDTLRYYQKKLRECVTFYIYTQELQMAALCSDVRNLNSDAAFFCVRPLNLQNKYT